jgi:PPOX class probable FMN-dependent enzyme
MDAHAIDDIAAVEALYGEPGRPAREKVITFLDDHCRELIALSPFCLLATSNAAGQCDVSPKGGQPGFVQILDDRTLAVPDATGNRRVDSLRNIVENPHAGLLFLIPTMGETLRVNGRAQITTDPELLQPFAVGRPPRLAVVVEVEQVYLHCAKALIRSRLWQPDTWPEQTPSAAQIFKDHIGLEENVAAMQAILDEGYANRL